MCLFNEAAIQRAVVSRGKGVTGLPLGYRVNSPVLLQSDIEFVDSKDRTKNGNPSPAGIFTLNEKVYIELRLNMLVNCFSSKKLA